MSSRGGGRVGFQGTTAKEKKTILSPMMPFFLVIINLALILILETEHTANIIVLSIPKKHENFKVVLFLEKKILSRMFRVQVVQSNKNNGPG